MARESVKRTKKCIVCGKEFLATELAQVCGSACRTALSRLKKSGQKPQYYIEAKSMGQRVPVWDNPTESKSTRSQLTFDEKMQHNAEIDRKILAVQKEVKPANAIYRAWEENKRQRMVELEKTKL